MSNIKGSVHDVVLHLIGLTNFQESRSYFGRYLDLKIVLLGVTNNYMAQYGPGTLEFGPELLLTPLWKPPFDSSQRS